MKTRKAFTIVELLLAMSFLGTMLVGISALIMRVTDIYQKGLSLRSVNAVGREIISDFTRIINSSQTNVDINPASSGSISLSDINAARANYYLATYSDDEDGQRQLGGVFCTGDYSYIWNTAENIRKARMAFNDGYTDSNVTKATSTNHIYMIAVKDGKTTNYIVPKLARFSDRKRSACVSEVVTKGSGSSKTTSYEPAATGDIKKNAYLFDFTGDAYKKTSNDIIELIERDESDLVLYNLSIFPATQHNKTKQIFYSGSFILATYRGGVNIKSNGDFCQGSSNMETGARDSELTLQDFSYCAVNKFNFAARATGERSIDQHGDR